MASGEIKDPYGSYNLRVKINGITSAASDTTRPFVDHTESRFIARSVARTHAVSLCAVLAQRSTNSNSSATDLIHTASSVETRSLDIRSSRV